MRVHGKRALLNPAGHHATAAIVAELTDTGRWKPGCDDDGPIPADEEWRAQPTYVMLKISDCDRAINLQIDWETAADRCAAVRKVTRLIDALTAFREGLIVEQGRYVERMRLVAKNPAKAD